MLNFDKTPIDLLSCVAFAGYSVQSAKKNAASQRPVEFCDFFLKSVKGAFAAKCLVNFVPVIISYTVKPLMDYMVDSYLGEFLMSKFSIGGLTDSLIQFTAYISLSENHKLIISQLLKFLTTPCTLLSSPGLLVPIGGALIILLLVWAYKKNQNKDQIIQACAVVFGVFFATIMDFVNPAYINLLYIVFIKNIINYFNNEYESLVNQTKSKKTIASEHEKLSKTSSTIEKKYDNIDGENSTYEEVIACINHVPSKNQMISIGEKIYKEKISKIPEGSRSSMDNALIAIIALRGKNQDFKALTDLYLTDFDKWVRAALDSFIKYQSDANRSIYEKLNLIKNRPCSNKFITRNLSQPFTKEDLREFMANDITKEALIAFGEKIYYEKINKIPNDKRSPEQSAAIALIDYRNKDLEFRSVTDPFIEEMLDKLLFKKIISFIDPKRELSNENYEDLNDILDKFKVDAGDQKLTLAEIKTVLAFLTSEKTPLIDFGVKVYKMKIKNDPNHSLSLKDKFTLPIIEARSKDNKFKSAIDPYGMELCTDFIHQRINSFISPEPEGDISSNRTLEVICNVIEKLKYCFRQSSIFEDACSLAISCAVSSICKESQKNAFLAILERRRNDKDFRLATDFLLSS